MIFVIYSRLWITIVLLIYNNKIGFRIVLKLLVFVRELKDILKYKLS